MLPGWHSYAGDDALSNGGLQEFVSEVADGRLHPRGQDVTRELGDFVKRSGDASLVAWLEENLSEVDRVTAGDAQDGRSRSSTLERYDAIEVVIFSGRIATNSGLQYELRVFSYDTHGGQSGAQALIYKHGL